MPLKPKRFVFIEANMPAIKAALSTLEVMHTDADLRFNRDEMRAIGTAIDLIIDILKADDDLLKMEIDLSDNQ